MKLVDGAGGEETEAATSLILGLPRPYIAIIVVLGIVSVAIVILVTVIATVCAPAETLHQFLAVIVIARYRPPGGGARRYAPADGSSALAYRFDATPAIMHPKIAADLHPFADRSAVRTSLVAGGG